MWRPQRDSIQSGLSVSRSFNLHPCKTNKVLNRAKCSGIVGLWMMRPAYGEGRQRFWLNLYSSRKNTWTSSFSQLSAQFFFTNLPKISFPASMRLESTSFFSWDTYPSFLPSSVRISIALSSCLFFGSRFRTRNWCFLSLGSISSKFKNVVPAILQLNRSTSWTNGFNCPSPVNEFLIILRNIYTYRW